jgi:hypothetical protein
MAGQNCVVVVIPSDEALEVEERLVGNDLSAAIANIVIQTDGSNDSDPLDVIPTILVREAPVRVYVYHYPAAARQTKARPNIRATRFAMACGHFAMRFTGTVVLTIDRTGGVNDHLALSSVIAATQNCDLRPHCLGDDHGDLPDWLLGACRNTYHDAAALQQLADVMVSDATLDSEPNANDDDNADVDVDADDDDPGSRDQSEKDADEEPREAATTAVPLCLWCRRPSSRLCARCHGVYFCNAECEANGYVHIPVPKNGHTRCTQPERSDSMSSQGGHTNVCATTTGYTRNGVLFCPRPVLENGPATSRHGLFSCQRTPTLLS